MSKLNHGFLEGSTLACNVIAHGIDTTSLVHLVGEIEVVPLLNHQAVEVIALLFEGKPLIRLILIFELEGRLFLNGAEELRIELQGHLVHGVQDIQADVSVMVITCAQDQRIVVGQVA